MLRLVLGAVIAIGMIGSASFAWLAIHAPAPPPPVPRMHPIRIAAPPPVTIRVLVAARDVRAGAILQGSDLRSADFTASSAPAAAERDTQTARRTLDGALVLRNVAEGNPVDRNDLVLRGDHGFLAALLRPGMRALTIGREALNADAALVSPGDRVDVILTQGAANEAVGGRRLAAETVVHAVRVLAVDRQLVPGSANAGDHGGPAASPAAVAVEVSPNQAEQLVIAERLGRLDFALLPSSPDGGTPTRGSHVTWAGDVMSSLVKPTDPSGPSTTVHVLDGGGGDKEYQY